MKKILLPVFLLLVACDASYRPDVTGSDAGTDTGSVADTGTDTKTGIDAGEGKTDTLEAPDTLSDTRPVSRCSPDRSVNTAEPSGDTVALADYGCEGVGTTLLAGASNGNTSVVTTDNSKVLSSTDGLNWFERYSDPAWSTSSHATYNHVFWSKLTSRFYIGGAFGSRTKLLSSPDGITWTKQTIGAKVPVAFVESDSIIVVADGFSSWLFISPDGVAWTPRENPAGTSVVAMAWNGSLFVAVDTKGNKITSPDGINWTNRGNTNNLSVNIDRGVVWTGSKFVTSEEVSIDGIVWTLRTGPVANELRVRDGVIYGVSEDKASLRTSNDGTTWSERALDVEVTGLFVTETNVLSLGGVNESPAINKGTR